MPQDRHGEPRDNRSMPEHPPEPVFCVVGETLCRVCIWSEEEWERLDPADRPALAEHSPGLGWVAPVPDRGPG